MLSAMMNRLAGRHETRRAVISARNISSGVPALLQWAGPWLSAEDTVGSHSTVNDAVTRIKTARKVAVLRRVIGENSCIGIRRGFKQQYHRVVETGGKANAREPDYFFVMIFAISMDHALCCPALLRARALGGFGDAREVMVNSVRHSGRMILSAGAMLVAVFLTFALSRRVASPRSV